MYKKSEYILFVMLLCFSGAAFSKSDVDVVTTVSVEMINMDISLSENILYQEAAVDKVATRTKNTKPEIQGANVGVTVIDNKFQYGFNTQITGQSSAEYTGVDTDDGTTVVNPSNELNTRSSFNLFAGYSISDKINISLGLTRGTSSYGDKISTKEIGPFISGRYGFRFGSSSSLSFDMSYSNLNTRLVLKDDVFLNKFNPDGHSLDTDTSGFSYSLTWVKSLDRGRSFFVRVKMIDLAINEGSTPVVDDFTTATKVGTAHVNGKQKLTSLSLGMAF